MSKCRGQKEYMLRNKVKYETGRSRDRQLTKVYIERQYKKWTMET